MHIEECTWKEKEPVNTIKMLERMKGYGKAYIVENGSPSDEGWKQITRKDILQFASLNYDIYYGVGRGYPARIYAKAPNNTNSLSVTRGVSKIVSNDVHHTHDFQSNLTTTNTPLKLTEAPNVKDLIEKVRKSGDLKQQMLQHKINGLILDYLSEADSP